MPACFSRCLLLVLVLVLAGCVHGWLADTATQ
jgi:hypothetical protein